MFIVDPLEKESRELLKMAESFYVHSVPVRIGVVFVVDSTKQVCGLDDPAVALVYAFDYLRKHNNAAKGLTFITDVSIMSHPEKLIRFLWNWVFSLNVKFIGYLHFFAGYL